MRSSHIFRRTFTLIEMLIVIVIIGILAAALIPRLQSVQGRARDSKRKVDLKSVNTALEIYKTDYGLYPRARNNFARTGDYDVDYWVLSYHTQPRISGMDNYMTSMPMDPLNSTGAYNFNIAIQWGTTWYTYLTGNSVYGYHHVYDGWKTYDLTAKLENTSDPDRCESRAYRYYYTTTWYTIPWCDATIMASYGPTLKYIYEYSPSSNSF